MFCFFLICFSSSIDKKSVLPNSLFTNNFDVKKLLIEFFEWKLIKCVLYFFIGFIVGFIRNQ